MLITGITKRVEIPHEPGEWMEFKKLSWRQIEVAASVYSDNALKRIKEMGGDLLASLRKLDSKEKEQAKDIPRYDKGTVLEAGIIKWSYNAKINKETIGELDEITAEWAFNEILGLNKKTEEEIKNG